MFCVTVVCKHAFRRSIEYGHCNDAGTSVSEYNEVLRLFVDVLYVVYGVTRRLSKDVFKHFQLELQSGCVKG